MTGIAPAVIAAVAPDLARAIGGVLIADNHLRPWLKFDHPPFSASMADGLRHYGQGAAFDLWVMRRAVDALRLAWVRSGAEAGAARAEGGEPGEQPRFGPAAGGG